RGRIGALELVSVINLEFVNSTTAVGAANCILKAPQRDVVMKLRREARLAAEVEILPVRAEEGIVGNLHILTPGPTETGGDFFLTQSIVEVQRVRAVHIKVLRVVIKPELSILFRRVREDEVVEGAVARARPPIISGNRVAVGDKR